jgi:hypothetical protein
MGVVSRGRLERDKSWFARLVRSFVLVKRLEGGGDLQMTQVRNQPQAALQE